MKKERININSLAPTKWNCKYPIVFAPKYNEVKLPRQILCASYIKI